MLAFAGTLAAFLSLSTTNGNSNDDPETETTTKTPDFPPQQPPFEQQKTKEEIAGLALQLERQKRQKKKQEPPSPLPDTPPWIKRDFGGGDDEEDDDETSQALQRIKEAHTTYPNHLGDGEPLCGWCDEPDGNHAESCPYRIAVEALEEKDDQSGEEKSFNVNGAVERAIQKGVTVDSGTTHGPSFPKGHLWEELSDDDKRILIRLMKHHPSIVCEQCGTTITPDNLEDRDRNHDLSHTVLFFRCSTCTTRHYMTVSDRNLAMIRDGLS